MKTAVTYNQLPIIPSVIAEVVCNTKYEGKELTNISGQEITNTEAKRLQMTAKEKNDFITYVDDRCKSAYNKEVSWFMNVIKSKSNKGRNDLYCTITHWLSAYLNSRD